VDLASDSELFAAGEYKMSSSSLKHNFIHKAGVMS